MAAVEHCGAIQTRLAGLIAQRLSGVLLDACSACHRLMPGQQFPGGSAAGDRTAPDTGDSGTGALESGLFCCLLSMGEIAAVNKTRTGMLDPLDQRSLGPFFERSGLCKQRAKQRPVRQVDRP
jgi:hypothetical protein